VNNLFIEGPPGQISYRLVESGPTLNLAALALSMLPGLKMNKPLVLVAGTRPAVQTVQNILGAEVECVSANSFDEALRRLQAHPDIIVCNVRFDESRMLDLLQAVKAEPATRDTPFVCFRLTPLSAALRKSIEVAVLALGAIAFVDLSTLDRDVDRDAAEASLRQIILSQVRQR
jgi:CheY-like chemotaxis protein